MPVPKKSRQGSNSTAAKLISRANSNKALVNQSFCNNTDSHSNGHANNNNINHVNNNHNNENNVASYGVGDGLTAKQQQQLERNAFLETQTKDQLRQECRRRGQKTTGNKTELVEYNFFFTITNNLKQNLHKLKIFFFVLFAKLLTVSTNVCI
jgi:hypothetical protein